uniref:Reverse transcriptase domain-containing protein n=1 Tax=Chromera velia CCMP2878 TaxID=1169474 RepID=A0A0G4F896_9ALVE|eukprot:Cvel_15678.t1-p1 / transcript=Cvel_15678.t1 / gene=Cvel_15678 / organism=Chromera_velia_CCMP2878 / gene_product=Transposon Ty3-I Gag-Pol polyprotein, putative / transcript_product=Transposon Ty3-I Gag-Pol polyprotein, putative / location=Cvel_scaffold1170:38308-38664(+) / protein_length=119 / sequence_SO=supercontig / SO=protein_coding / is_pseudo=false
MLVAAPPLSVNTWPHKADHTFSQHHRPAHANGGFIRPSTSPFGAPAFFVKKKDGTFRMVIDYRPPNKVTVKDTFPLPHAEELMETFFGKRWFTKLDLRQFFHQLRITMGDSYKTAFITR